MSAHVNQLIEAQNAAIDAQPEMIRSQQSTSLIACGNSLFKVWWGNGYQPVATYGEATRLMEKSLADGAGVCVIEWTHGREWRQEIWALTMQEAS